MQGRKEERERQIIRANREGAWSGEAARVTGRRGGRGAGGRGPGGAGAGIALTPHVITLHYGDVACRVSRQCDRPCIPLSPPLLLSSTLQATSSHANVFVSPPPFPPIRDSHVGKGAPSLPPRPPFERCAKEADRRQKSVLIGPFFKVRCRFRCARRRLAAWNMTL